MDMELWKQKICDAGRNLGRSKGMVKYHQGELGYCDDEESREIMKLIALWDKQEKEDEKALDNLVEELKEHLQSELRGKKKSSWPHCYHCADRGCRICSRSI